MKTSSKLKALTLVLVIVLVAILAFLGVYDIRNVHSDNLVKDYKVGMELEGKRIVRLKVDDSVNEVIYDNEGNIVEEKDDKGEYTVKEEPVNAPDILNKENYKKSVKIIEDRLNSMGAKEYKIRFNEENGTIELDMIEDEQTNYIINELIVKGDFTITDEETGEVLIDKSCVKKVNVNKQAIDQTYSVTALDIVLNKDGAKKLEEISKKYVKTTEEVVNEEGQAEEKTTEKKIVIKQDDTTITTMSFDNVVADGVLKLYMGDATSDAKKLEETTFQANIRAATIQTDIMPVVYTIEQNVYVTTNMNQSIITTVVIGALIIEAILLIVVFKVKGIVSAIIQIGYVALVLLIVRCVNVYITLEGVFALVLVSILNMVYIYKTLLKIKEEGNVPKAIKESLISFMKVSIPVLIVAIVFCFVKYLEINSFGMVIFWGYVISLLYNIIFTKGILINTFKK